MADFKLGVIISAVDKITKPVSGIVRNLKTITKPVRTLQDSFRRFGRETQMPELLTRTRALGSSIGRLGSEASAMARRGILAFTGLATALFFTIKRITGLGDTTAKTADRLGVSVEQFEKWKFAAERSGLSVGEFTTSIRMMQRQAVNAERDTKSAAAGIFRALDVDVANIKDPSVLLDAFADGIDKIENPIKRNAVLMEIMGRSGGQMATLLKGGSENIRELGEDAVRVGAVLGEDFARQSEKTQDLLTNLSFALKGITSRFVKDFLPAINRIIPRFVEFINKNKALINLKIISFVEGLVLPFDILGESIEFVSEVISEELNISLNNFKNIGLTISTLIQLKLVVSFGSLIISVYNVIKAFALFDVQLIKTIALMIGTAIKGIATLVISLTSLLLPSIIGATAAMWGFTVALFANPIFPVITLVAALAGIAFLLVKNWKPIATFFVALWNDILSTFTKAVDFVFDIGVNFVNSFLAGVKSIWNSVTSFFETSISNLIPKSIKGFLGIETPKIASPPLAPTFRRRELLPLRTIPSHVGQEGTRMQSMHGKIVIDFQNAPKGTRIIEKSIEGDANFDIDTGLSFALP